MLGTTPMVFAYLPINFDHFLAPNILVGCLHPDGHHCEALAGGLHTEVLAGGQGRLLVGPLSKKLFRIARTETTVSCWQAWPGCAPLIFFICHFPFYILCSTQMENEK